MKSLKKFLALALALALCFVMALPAMAEETTYTLTLKGSKPGHTYSIYQIYSGDVDGKDDGETVTDGVTGGNGITLSNVKYGAQYPGDDGTTGGLVPKEKLDELAGMKNNSNAIKAWADNMKDLIDDKGESFTPAQKIELGADETEKSVKVPAGYYLVIDEGYKAGENTPNDDVKSALLVEVVGATTVTAKTTTTSFDKKVDVAPTDPTVDISGLENVDDAVNVKIGDEVAFNLVTTIPVDQLAQYDFYTVEFVDKMSKGLEFVEGSQKIKITTDDTNFTAIEPTINSNYNWFDDVAEGGVLAKENVTGFTGQSGYGFKTEKVTDETALNAEVADVFNLLGGKDQIPSSGNIYVTLAYKARLTADAETTSIDGSDTGNMNEAFIKYTNDPEKSSKGGTSTTDKTFVYSFLLDITKKNGADTTETLLGAEFNLYKATDKDEKDGDAINFVRVGNDYVVYTKDNFPNEEEKNISPKISSLEGGKLNVKGLNAGRYILEETAAPDGYNKCDPILIVITATEETDGADANNPIGTNTPSVTLTMTYKSLGGDATVAGTDPNKSEVTNGGKKDEDGNVTNGTIMDVLNNKGTLLPSTGGIGTTIFYAAGGALVVGAGVLLFVKKRMGSKG